MILTHLELTNFRNYEKLAIDFERGLSLFLGPTGVGKSNLAEAIHYLSLARSWRTNEDRPLIKEGAEEAIIFAKIEEGSFRRSISIAIGKEGKRIEVNGKKVDVEKVSYGFMAVKAEAGENNIVFRYETPGLKYGIIISISGIALLLGYLVICFIIKKKSKNNVDKS